VGVIAGLDVSVERGEEVLQGGRRRGLRLGRHLEGVGAKQEGGERTTAREGSTRCEKTGSLRRQSAQGFFFGLLYFLVFFRAFEKNSKRF
jgi:hypothetical protein